MFLLVLKLYQMDVAHAILFARKLDVSRLTVRYLSAKFILGKLLKSLPSFWREAFVKIVGAKLEFEEGYRNPL